MSKQNQAKSQIPETGFLRLNQIVKSPNNHAPLLPLCRTTWLKGIKAGIYPAPVRIGARAVAWRVEDIHALIEKLGGAK